ncbi:MAG: iron uptake porin [Moorea sp. SIO4A1]|uniref:iron uptake porin n=2 Tax=unclassified Moorena TaxID=2683338 RepID=UPI00144FF4CE|nr:iron uptake porin [Moorena sp. SIO4A1]NEQ57668.1 iron uptake porin [Moorena sp. SIO4A1]
MLKLTWSLPHVTPAAIAAAFLLTPNGLANESQPKSTTAQELSIAVELLPPISVEVMEQVTPVDQLLPGSPITELPTSTQGFDHELTPHIEPNIEQTDDPMAQVTSVSQLSDVQPTDWAFQALQSIVERYGCMAGYPDGSYRGNRPLNRYEFAAALNTCFDQLSKVIAAPDLSSSYFKEDLEAIKGLQGEFTLELARLRGNLDAVTARTAEVEITEFSTTTKLNGEVDFILIDYFTDNKAAPCCSSPTQDDSLTTTFTGQALLSFDTSFTGKDLLRTRIDATNVPELNNPLDGTDMTLYDFDTNTDQDFVLTELYYRFPISDRIQAHIAAAGLSADEITDPLNPVSALSRFGVHNPLYRLTEGGGAAIRYQFNDSIRISVAYLGSAASISNPTEGNGLFNGQFGAFTQLTLTPNQRLGIGLNYVHYYSPEPNSGIDVTGSTGSQFSQAPFGDQTATSANGFGLQARYRFSPGFALGGWLSYINANAESSPRQSGFDGSKGAKADIWTWAITMAFPDLGKEGNELGFVFGMPPRLAENDINSRQDSDVSYHLETFYRYQINDNISITPGLFVIISPEHNSNNNSIVVPMVKTKFIF